MSESNICRVEQVHVEDTGVFIDAQHLSRPSVDYRNVPLMNDFSGVFAVPQVLQKVVITETSNGYEYVEGVLTGPEDPGPSLVEGEFAIQFDPNTRFHFTENGDSYDLNIKASGNVTVESQQNVLIKAGGDVLIGENGDPVALQNHTHDYDDTGDTSDGTAGTTNKTTSQPNESGTNTKIE